MSQFLFALRPRSAAPLDRWFDPAAKTPSVYISTPWIRKAAQRNLPGLFGDGNIHAWMWHERASSALQRSYLLSGVLRSAPKASEMAQKNTARALGSSVRGPARAARSTAHPPHMSCPAVPGFDVGARQDAHDPRMANQLAIAPITSQIAISAGSIGSSRRGMLRVDLLCSPRQPWMGSAASPAFRRSLF
jgi:hypothetical protein